MKLLFFKSNTFMQDDWFDTLIRLGYDVDPVTYIFTDYLDDAFFAEKLRRRLRRISYDAIASFCFYPILSDLCKEFRIQYISWNYDSPIPHLTRFDSPYNHIYHFDKEDVKTYQEQGYSLIRHLPLAVNTERLDRQLSPLSDIPDYYHDICFVGNLYDNRSIRYRNFISPVYLQGILEGYAAAQTQFFNQDAAGELLENSPYIKKDSLPAEFPWNNLVRAVHEEATHQERHRILQKLSQHFCVDLYTSDTITDKGQLHVHPSIGYYTDMPLIFRHSRINLNINYRSIRSGMSARILDIMGAGGFLMTTPQPELFDYFTPEEDFVSFSSTDELIDKCRYYLTHEAERHQIALNGYRKVKQAHTYDARLPYLFATL